MSTRIVAVYSSIAVASVAAWLFASGSLAGPPEAKQADAVWPPKIVRKLPPVVPPLAEAELKQAIEARDALKSAVEGLTGDYAAELAPDVEIFHKSLDFAIRHNEFFDPKGDGARIAALKRVGLERAAILKQGKSPWSEARGTLVRGFRSEIDDSVQPYGLVIPEMLDLSKPVPLYVWLHGRGDKQCDLQFISQFLDPKKKPGPMLPENAIVLHPFGRYCNGYKSAGETDVLEAIAEVQKRYKIDANRIVMAGFSMGGAGAWHLGAHYADRWCAVHAGAGFVDVRRYQNITADKMPPSYVQTLWGLYDVPEYRRNFFNVPLIAYSGADDKQKQAADIMEAELARESFKLPHIIGPGVAHKYEPNALAEVQSRLSAIVAKGKEYRPKKNTFQTRTLRYSTPNRFQVWGLERHWDDARVDFEQIGEKASLRTKNVTALAFDDASLRKFEIDGIPLGPNPMTDQEGDFFLKIDGRWKSVAYEDFNAYLPGRKTPNLQGPIDDAFYDPFTVVSPQATSEATAIDRWAAFESKHFLRRWAELMRGDAKTAPADAIGREQLEVRNLVLWGTPKSNPLIAQMLDKLPIRWTDKTIGIGDLEFDATKVVPVLIYPNPLTKEKRHFIYEPPYVVLNSGLTFREGHDHTNSQQNPKLPDWAMIDVTEPPSELYPGKVVAAGFFDEEWKFDPTRTYKSDDGK